MARGQLSLESSAEDSAEDDMAAALAAFGLEYEGDLVIEEDEFWLWPENEEVFWLWAGLQTQWMASMAGAIGLNYASVETDFRMLQVPLERQREYYILIKHMERETLAEWASKR
jgi:hypothetical protein